MPHLYNYLNQYSCLVILSQPNSHYEMDCIWFMAQLFCHHCWKRYLHFLWVLQSYFIHCLFEDVNMTNMEIIFITILEGCLDCSSHYTLSEQKKKVHRFTNNLQGLQKVRVKDFSWNIVLWNALLFEKILKQLSILDIDNYGFILNTCHDTAKSADWA